ncbi:DUF5723 family protein [Luteibaculum oceani]|uniref:DUF5723 domain-containing protein n=1 Tax=Luteibaculum oceani TaxID=1294296 RepID=A0A5C6V0C6_9FLAO|nr:DUF5723 family protein [Luteibaculum oceani]TXC78354.1 hypothetical protein FRX97_08470 [Luteibaculum oceani]
MKKLILSLFIGLLGLSASAQTDISLFGMSNLYQKRYLNPAYQPQSKLQIGLPGISSVAFNGYNTGFKPGDFVSFDGSTGGKVDRNEILNGLEPINTFGFVGNIDLFSLGFSLGKTYVSLGVRANLDFQTYYSKGLMELVLIGNGGDNLGKRISLDGSGVDFSAYTEMTIGAAHQVNDKLSVGATAKIIQGQLNINTAELKGGVTTNEEDYSITFDGAIDLRMNNLDLDSEDIIDIDKILEGLPNSPNKGFGLDLGATYLVNDKLKVGASILDIGSINWSEENANVYKNPNFEFTYQGMDFFDFTSGSSDDGSFTELLDSLSAELKTDRSKEAYTTKLNTQVILSGGYKITPRSEAGLMVRNYLNRKSAKFAASAYYGVSLKDWITASINASYANRSIANVGAGVSFRLGTLQLYAMSDNLLGIVSPESAKTVQTRLGMNLIFGKRNMFDETELAPEIPATEPEVEVEPAAKPEVKKLTPEEKKKAKEAKKAAKQKAKEEKEKAEEEQKFKEEEDDNDSGLEYITPAELKKREAEEKAAAEQKAKEAAKAEQEKAKAEQEKAKAAAKEAKNKTKEDAKKAKEEAKAKKEKAKADKKAEKEKAKKAEGEFDNWNEPEKNEE